LPNEDKKNWIACVQDREKWKEVVEKVKTFTIKGSSAPGRRRRSISVFTQSARYSCQILMKLEFSRQFFEKILKYQICENPSSGSRVVPCGQTDGHDEANSRLKTNYDELFS
jgi:hypothetical protein